MGNVQSPDIPHEHYLKQHYCSHSNATANEFAPKNEGLIPHPGRASRKQKIVKHVYQNEYSDLYDREWVAHVCMLTRYSVSPGRVGLIGCYNKT